MNVSRRTLFTCLFAVVVGAAGCGGSATDDGVSATDAAARRGGTTTPASLGAAPDPANRDGNFTVSFYPGSYANQKLFIKWQCYQNGQMLAFDGSYDLAAAVSQGLPGYAWVGDHYEWTFVMSQVYNYALGSGPASCNMQGWYENRKLQWYQIASGVFSVQ